MMKTVASGSIQFRSHSTQGFTLLEGLIVITILAILAAIAAPGFISWFNERQLTTVQQEIYQGVQLAQRKAQQNRSSWRFSIRAQKDHLEWSVHPNTTLPTQVPTWNALRDGVQFAAQDVTFKRKAGVYYVLFDERGNTNSLGTLTLATPHSKARRCVIVSTLIGATRQGRDRAQANQNGRYCY